MKTARQKDRVYVFRVTVDMDESSKMHDGVANRRLRRSGVAPVREVAVLDRQSLYTLAEGINDAFGFAFDHCFGFYSETPKEGYHEADRQYELFADLPDVEPTRAASVEKTLVHEVWEKPGDRIRFLFDYGDMWWFLVELVRMEPPQRRRYPYTARKEGQSPQQYPPAR